MIQNKIGVIDSGIGGLNVLKKLIISKPNNNYIYYGDTVHLPYGNKSKEELLGYVSKIIDFLISLGVNTIVLACGTISSTIYDDLCIKYSNIKIISIISNTCYYLNNSNYNNILVIGTENTINSHIFKNYINKNVYEVATQDFVMLLENKEFDKIDYYIDYYLNKYKNCNCIVLGCTHFVLIKDKLEKYLGIPSIDMGDYIASSINEDKCSSLELYFSSVNDNLLDNIKDIIGNVNVIEKRL